MRRNYSRKNSGLTLVEVIFSLALVGTLLVTLMVAHRRCAQQTEVAKKQLVAIEELDRLLADFTIQAERRKN